VRSAALALVLLAAACRHGRVHSGDVVTIRYELSAEGAVIESILAGEPVAVTQGAGQVPPGVDEALLGMAPGEEKRLDLPPEKAFGPHDPARVETLPRERLGKLADGLKPGGKVMGFRDGKPQTAKVLDIGGGKIVLDFNSPLAGKTVLYRVQVVSIAGAR
jgi:FKBP-type peptidyl-prolyl cis-trans isomerase 2